MRSDLLLLILKHFHFHFEMWFYLVSLTLNIMPMWILFENKFYIESEGKRMKNSPFFLLDFFYYSSHFLMYCSLSVFFYQLIKFFTNIFRSLFFLLVINFIFVIPLRIMTTNQQVLINTRFLCLREVINFVFFAVSAVTRRLTPIISIQWLSLAHEFSIFLEHFVELSVLPYFASYPWKWMEKWEEKPFGKCVLNG